MWGNDGRVRVLWVELCGFRDTTPWFSLVCLDAGWHKRGGLILIEGKPPADTLDTFNPFENLAPKRSDPRARA